MQAEREARIANEGHGDEGLLKAVGLRAWARESWTAIKDNWVLFIYMVILMTGKCAPALTSCIH